MRLLLMFPSIIPAMSLPVGTLPRPPEAAAVVAEERILFHKVNL